MDMVLETWVIYFKRAEIMKLDSILCSARCHAFGDRKNLYPAPCHALIMDAAFSVDVLTPTIPVKRIGAAAGGSYIGSCQAYYSTFLWSIQFDGYWWGMGANLYS
jgi:hypothetical protein